MRLWSLHPSLLDQKGLLAAWREGLLAQSVIIKLQNGQKPGYRNHPQLQRFLASPVPLLLIGTWLTFIQEEATERGYRFDYDKIVRPGKMFKLVVSSGQLEYERKHLLGKLEGRSPVCYNKLINIDAHPHPMFEVINGEVEDWERVENES